MKTEKAYRILARIMLLVSVFFLLTAFTSLTILNAVASFIVGILCAFLAMQSELQSNMIERDRQDAEWRRQSAGCAHA